MVAYPSVKAYNADGTPNQLDSQSWLRDEQNRTTLATTASNPLAIIEGVDDNLKQNRTFEIFCRIRHNRWFNIQNFFWC